MGTILEKLDTIEKKLDDSDRENQSHKTQLILDQEEQFVLRLFELLFPNLQTNVKDSIKNIGSSRSFFSDFLNHAVTLKQIEWRMLEQTFPSKKYSVDKIRKTVEMNNRLR